MKFEDVYYEEITTASYRELVNVGRWFNRLIGYHPLLVGGWAVYYYNPTGLGSRDVDLIFPDRRSKDKLVNLYLFNNGYQRQRISEFEENYVLVIQTSKGEERLYLDVATVQDHNVVHGGGPELPWSLAYEHQREATFEKATFYVPTPEVLLLLKAKAALDREYDAKRAFDPFLLQQKSWKDYYDMASLLKTCEFDARLLSSLLHRHDFESYFETVMDSLARKRDVLARHDASWPELATKLGDLL
ncbi:MAG: hypothetical protein ACE5HJ_09620 [Thermoplasmata archaeon]